MVWVIVCVLCYSSLLANVCVWSVHWVLCTIRTNGIMGYQLSFLTSMLFVSLSISPSLYLYLCVCTSTEIPENVTLGILNHTGPLLEGQEYWLQCVVQSVAPANHLTVIWFRGDTELKRSGFPQFSIEGDLSKDVTVRTKLSLTASREDHEASYSCAAKLDLNTAEPIPETRSSIQLEAVFCKSFKI